MTKILSTAPGRVCLFGDHQDYLELPVIACAIDRMMEIYAKENGKDHFEINMPDMNQKGSSLSNKTLMKLNEVIF